MRLLLAAGPLWLASCSTPIWPNCCQAPAPENTYATAPVLPANVRRVALLPVSSLSSSADLAFARLAYAPVIQQEILKTERFEVVPVSPENLISWTGREVWDTADTLPAKFLELISQRTGCDAVLFARIIAFRAYPPLEVGWTFQLVNVENNQPVWAAERVFDAGNPSVAESAQCYQTRQERAPGLLGKGESILQSPRRFAQFTLAATFGTIPTR